MSRRSRLVRNTSPGWRAPEKKPSSSGHGGFGSAVCRLLRRARDEFDIFRRLFGLAEGVRGYLPLMAALALLSSMFEGVSLTLIIPLVQVLDVGAIPATSDHHLLHVLYAALASVPKGLRLPLVLAAMVGAIIVKSAISYINMAILGLVYGRLSHAMRCGIYTKILERPLAQAERDSSGRLLNMLNNETWRATDALNYLFTIITTLATMLVFVVLLFLLSWHLSLAALVLMTIVPPLLQLITRRVKRLSAIALEANEALAQRVWTSLNGLRIIHAFGREEFEKTRFSQSSERVRSLFYRMALISMTAGPVTEVLVTGVVAVLALLVDASHVSMPALVAFLAILYRLQPRLLALVSAQASLHGLHAPVMAVSEAFSASTRPELVEAKSRFTGLRDGIRFQGVSFTHHGARVPALANVSFGAELGGMTALVGASGAGKSTLLDLLLRFHEPQRGRILADGVPIVDYDLASWRSRLAVVSQDPYIFDDTIRANLLYGRPEASEVDMIRAAQFACADDFIRALPNGYDTKVGERGTQISGGQRQRLALARALIRDPDILILDEATNALDTLTERAFQDALKQLSRDRLVLVVAHRLATIEYADRVVVLDAGSVVEQGCPQALLRAGGLFAKMFVPFWSAASEDTAASWTAAT